MAVLGLYTCQSSKVNVLWLCIVIRPHKGKGAFGFPARKLKRLKGRNKHNSLHIKNSLCILEHFSCIKSSLLRVKVSPLSFGLHLTLNNGSTSCCSGSQSESSGRASFLCMSFTQCRQAADFLLLCLDNNISSTPHLLWVFDPEEYRQLLFRFVFLLYCSLLTSELCL